MYSRSVLVQIVVWFIKLFMTVRCNCWRLIRYGRSVATFYTEVVKFI